LKDQLNFLVLRVKPYKFAARQTHLLQFHVEVEHRQLTLSLQIVLLFIAALIVTQLFRRLDVLQTPGELLQLRLGQSILAFDGIVNNEENGMIFCVLDSLEDLLKFVRRSVVEKELQIVGSRGKQVLSLWSLKFEMGDALSQQERDHFLQGHPGEQDH
jgi:hypothetical protein